MNTKNIDINAVRSDAEVGSAKAQYILGWMYRTGNGVPQDYVEAYHWYKKAAEQGESRSQGALRIMYLKGQGTQQDYASSAQWAQKAAVQGDTQSQAGLGMLYLGGMGVKPSNVMAYVWLSIAVRKGFRSWKHRALLHLLRLIQNKKQRQEAKVLLEETLLQIKGQAI